VADAFFHHFYRGVLLPKIAYSLGVRQIHHKEVCGILHLEFKKYFCIKTTADLSNHRFLVYMSAILMIMAREKGTLVPFFNEPDDIEEMTMRQWLDLQQIIDK